MLPFIWQIRQGVLAVFEADDADAVCGCRADPILHPSVTGHLGAGASLSAPPFPSRQALLCKAAATVFNKLELCSSPFWHLSARLGQCPVHRRHREPPGRLPGAGGAHHHRTCICRALAMQALHAQLQGHSRPTKQELLLLTSTRQTQWRRRKAAELAMALPLKAVTCSFTGRLCPSVGGSWYAPATRRFLLLAQGNDFYTNQKCTMVKSFPSRMIFHWKNEDLTDSECCSGSGYLPKSKQALPAHSLPASHRQSPVLAGCLPAARLLGEAQPSEKGFLTSTGGKFPSS